MINEKSPLQRKALDSFLGKMDDLFWQRADEFAGKMSGLCIRNSISFEYIVNAYLKMCNDMLTEQIKFRKSGSYSIASAKDANDKVYSSEIEMSSYMYGLALSQFLWPNHYAMYDFFIRQSRKLKGIKTYLEIGPGHGLYLVEALKLFSKAEFLAIDISHISKKISQSIVEHYMPDVKCKFFISDVHDIKGERFDYIVMCEVLEHLDRPLEVLRKIKELLSDNGRLFITTCANCPAIDHVYLYRCIDHIREDIDSAGFRIVEDLPLPVNKTIERDWHGMNIESNYAAMLRKN
jgi:2-polyprenyl-3-methyl-5-hydroxy-6-metoxy-1,4-benzoquinol methylase